MTEPVGYALVELYHSSRLVRKFIANFPTLIGTYRLTARCPHSPEWGL